MWKDWLNRLGQAHAVADPLEARATFQRAVEEARAREEASLALFEQLTFALRMAESPVPIDRATIPLNLSLGPERVEELAAQLKLSTYLRTNILALVHRFREDRRDLKNAERAAEMLEASPTWNVRGEALQHIYQLFHFLAASREQFRDYPLFYQLFGGTVGTGPLASPPAVPEDLQFFIAEGLQELVLAAPAGEGEGDPRHPEAMFSLMEVPPLELEVGIDLVPLVDPVMGGELIQKLGPIRLAIARELGFVTPGVRFQENFEARPNGYRVKVRGNQVASGELMLGYHLAVETPEAEAAGVELVGFPTSEPALGRPATWVTRAESHRAAKHGYLVFDATQVLVRHLDEVIRSHAHEILSIEDVSLMLDHLRERAATTVDTVVPDKLELAEYHWVLRNLLRERVSIRDQITILEKLAHASRPLHPFYLADRFGENKASIEAIMLMEISAQIRPLDDPTILTESVRVALARQICASIADAAGTLDVVVLSRQLEQTILDGIQTATTGQSLTLAPATRDLLVTRLVAEASRMERPAVLCDPRIRPFVKQLTTRALPRLTVLSHAELHPQFHVQSVGTVSLVES